MATISTTTVGFAARPSPAAGLPQLNVARAARLRCSYSKELKKKASSAECGQGREAEVQLLQGAQEEGVLSSGSGGSQGAPLLVAAPSLVEVDERMSAERTWLGDNLLGWILLGAVGLVLCFHSVYSYILDDGDQSGAGGNTL